MCVCVFTYHVVVSKDSDVILTKFVLGLHGITKGVLTTRVSCIKIYMKYRYHTRTVTSKLMADKNNTHKQHSYHAIPDHSNQTTPFDFS